MVIKKRCCKIPEDNDDSVSENSSSGDILMNAPKAPKLKPLKSPEISS